MSLIERQERAYQIPYEIESLQNLVASKNPKVIVEIGSSFGGTLPRWLFLDGAQTIISIDLPDGSFGGVSREEKDELRKECEEYSASHGKVFYQILSDSHQPITVDKLNAILQTGKIDFLFIDGDHSYEGVLRDFQMYAGLVKEGGLIGFHDILNSKFHRKSGSYVQALWHRLKRFFFYSEFITDDKEEYKRIMPWSYPTGFGGIGVIKYDSSIFQRFISQTSIQGKPRDIVLTLSALFRRNSRYRTVL